jgi:glutathione S-transferase
MLKLFYTTTSPYVRKVTAVAHELGLFSQIELLPAAAHPVERDKAVVAKNPLGKVPTLLTEEGEVLFDSRVIIEFLLARAPGQTLLPASGAARWAILRQQALADGLLDAALLIRYENAIRPANMRSAAWLDGQYEKIASALDGIEADAANLDQTVTIGSIATAAALGFLDFRFAEYDWRKQHPRAAAWFAAFDDLPSLSRTRPYTPATAQAATR